MPLTEQALNDFGKLFVDYMKRRIQQKIYPYGNPERGKGNKVASGNLLNSLTYSVEATTQGGVLKITYADYFKNVNMGRRPRVKRVPLNVLLKWIKIKKIRGRDKRGRFIKDLSLAWAVQTNIFKYGIRPTYIYDKTLDSIEDLFDNPPPEIEAELNDLFDAIEGDINNLLENMVEEEFKNI